MKKLWIAGLSAMILSITTMPSMAADNLPPIITKGYPVSPAYNWTGFYIGVHGGTGFAGTMQDISNPGAQKLSTQGGFGGIQAGYNWQINRVVFGAEVDASFGDIGKSWGGVNGFDPYYGKDATKTFGTVKGRVGYTFDRLLVYGTGGLAWGDNEHGFGCDATRTVATNGCQNKPGGTAFYTSTNSTDIGYTVGGGLEYALADRWTIRGEYLYTDFGTNKINMTDPNYPAARSERNFSTKFQTITAGINYRF